jgi:hypothetical protein
MHCSMRCAQVADLPGYAGPRLRRTRQVRRLQISASALRVLALCQKRVQLAHFEAASDLLGRWPALGA